MCSNSSHVGASLTRATSNGFICLFNYDAPLTFSCCFELLSFWAVKTGELLLAGISITSAGKEHKDNVRRLFYFFFSSRLNRLIVLILSSTVIQIISYKTAHFSFPACSSV